MEVEKKMCDALKELFAEELKEADHQGMERGRSEGMERGWSEGIERGRAEGLKLAKTIFRLSAQGVPAEEIAQQCGLSADQVREVLE